ncbi:MAG: hypothetical protein K9K93_04840 [Acholeplasmataceae bacterium]|nr:hypothetical protein [Acholeplasmataceae bacterium]
MKKFFRFLADPIRSVGRNDITDIIIDLLSKHPAILAFFAFLITLTIMAATYVLPHLRG